MSQTTFTTGGYQSGTGPIIVLPSGDNINVSTQPQAVFFGDLDSNAGESTTDKVTIASTDGTPSSTFNLGDLASTEKLAETIIITEEVTIDTLFAVVKNTGDDGIERQGSPTDNVRMSLQTDSGGVPSGTEVVGAEIVGSTLAPSGSSNNNDTEFGVTRTTIAPGTYWLVVERTGPVDGSNYYIIGREGSNGNVHYYDGTWNAGSGTQCGTRDSICVGIKKTLNVSEVFLSYDGENANMNSISNPLCGASVGDEATLAKHFGFAITNASPGEDVSVVLTGVVSGFSGLTPNTEYYLDSVQGGITANPSNGRDIKVGLAITDEVLLIDRTKVYSSDLSVQVDAFSNTYDVTI